MGGIIQFAHSDYHLNAILVIRLIFVDMSVPIKDTAWRWSYQVDLEGTRSLGE